VGEQNLFKNFYQTNSYQRGAKKKGLSPQKTFSKKKGEKYRKWGPFWGEVWAPRAKKSFLGNKKPFGIPPGRV